MSWLIEQYRRSAKGAREDSVGLVRLSPHSFYVGDLWVGVVLITTRDGILMIDSGITGQLPAIFDAVRALGYDPYKDIKLCLLSHAHCDHCSGMKQLQELAGPVVYMSELEKNWPGKAPCYAGLPEDIDPVAPFTADRYYDGTLITLGDMCILPVHTPGHSIGTHSFFYTDTDEAGRTYQVALHGGLGLNTLADGCFTDREAALAMRGIYRQSAESLLDREVDITITNHGGNINLGGKLGTDRMDFAPFVDKSLWRRHIENKLRQLDELERNSIYI